MKLKHSLKVTFQLRRRLLKSTKISNTSKSSFKEKKLFNRCSRWSSTLKPTSRLKPQTPNNASSHYSTSTLPKWPRLKTNTFKRRLKMQNSTPRCKSWLVNSSCSRIVRRPYSIRVPCWKKRFKDGQMSLYNRLKSCQPRGCKRYQIASTRLAPNIRRRF